MSWGNAVRQLKDARFAFDLCAASTLISAFRAKMAQFGYPAHPAPSTSPSAAMQHGACPAARLQREIIERLPAKKATFHDSRHGEASEHAGKSDKCPGDNCRNLANAPGAIVRIQLDHGKTPRRRVRMPGNGRLAHSSSHIRMSKPHPKSLGSPLTSLSWSNNPLFCQIRLNLLRT